jgi:O-acetyl-ADP-ribose deacetylase
VRVTIFVGDLAAAPAEALCTSTNPRLSLFMGTGASVRHAGGFEILRACEAIVSAKRVLPPGSAHVTPAGSLPCKAIIHCVASDVSHRSSAAIVSACVTNALQHAADLHCQSIAMPVFASGHAHLDYSTAVSVMCDAIHESSTNIAHIFIVIYDRSREDATRRAILEHLPGAVVETVISETDASEPASTWFSDDG